MQKIDHLLDIREHTREGYLPLIDFGAWRVAILNFSPDLLPENLTSMQRHNETDEVFVLLKGRCLLFVAEGGDTATTIHAQDMQPLKVYNVKKAVWHTHALTEDASILIVENRDTTYDNSPFYPLSAAQRQIVRDVAARLWALVRPVG